MSQDDTEAPRPLPQPTLFKILCCPVDTKIGRSVVRKLYTPYEDNTATRNIILGSMEGEDRTRVPEGVRKIVDISNTNTFFRMLKDCDVFVLDIFKIPHEQVEYAIKTINYFNDGKNRQLILISSLRTWATTKPKEKKEGDEEEVEDDLPPMEDDGEEGEGEGEEEEEEEAQNEEGNGEDQGDEDNEEDAPKKEYLPFSENDYNLRRTYPIYRKHRSLESMCLSAQKSNPQFTGFIVAPGILYGNGEEVLFPYFKQAWLQDPPNFKFYGDGKNKMPTIHYDDLAMHVKYLVYKPPKRIRYVFAVDYTKKREQKKILKTISKGIGCGGMEQVENEDEEKLFHTVDNYDLLSLDLWLRPSKIFNEPRLEDEEEEEEADQEDEEDLQDPQEELNEIDDEDERNEKVNDPEFQYRQARWQLRLKFKWVSQRGIAPRTVKLLNKQFNATRNLKPNKIVIHGPPCSGKTYYAAQLASFYNIPHITIQDVVQKSKLIKGELQEQLVAHLEEEKEAMMEKERERLEKLRAQGRLKMKDDEDIELKEADFKPRMNDEFLIKCFKWRLAQNDCLNRGYVLDSFPRKYKNARHLFMNERTEGEEGDEDEEEEEASEEGGEPEPPRVIDPRIKPDTILMLNAPKSYMMHYIDRITEEEIAGTHYTEKDLDRRLKRWETNNISDDASFVLEDFYNQMKIEVLKINLDLDTAEDCLKSMRIFIERNGQFNNYQSHQQETENQRLQQEQKLADEKEKKRTQQQEKNLAREQEDILVQEEEVRLKMSKHRSEEAKIVEQKSETLKKYFSDNMTDILKEALFDLSKTMPEDPIDHIADFLFKNAYKVPEMARGDI